MLEGLILWIMCTLYILKASVVKSLSITTIDTLNQPAINTQLIFDLHSIGTPVDTLLVLYPHLGRQSTINQLLMKCQLNINLALIMMSLEC